ncbi:DUF4189 domain-containing protein [Xanthomonas arboricola pv. corylina]|uniref:DUF4189 domain-containing protein n=1 Tax=Xanthomonas arboricola TaxID=56448 RepID=UPI004040B365
MQKKILILFLLSFMDIAIAEEGCPAGQIPAQAGGGPTSCGPIPQGYYKNNSTPRPTGKWIKTWGAIALGVVNTVPHYGVPTGLHSKAEAEEEALSRCKRIGAEGCYIVLTYRNQCAAIGEPQTNGQPNPDGYVQFVSEATKEGASRTVLNRCNARNPNMECEVIFSKCSEPIFQKF